MFTPTRPSRLLVAAAVAALPFTSASCGRTACFTWTPMEGACPAQAEALPFFSDPKCPGKVVSVDSDGTLTHESQLCCYSVTQRDATTASLCAGAGGASGGSESAGFGGATGFSVSSTSSAIPDGGAPCVRCGDAFAVPQPKPVCPDSAERLNAVMICACSGACAAACGDSLCASTSVSSACFDCLENQAGCQTEFIACANDI